MKSPLKAKPLHNPGESLDKQIDTIINNEVDFIALLVGCFIVITVLEWYRFYTEMPPNPVLFTIVTAVLFAYGFYKIRKIKKKLKKLRQGRDGEKVVGQFLDELRETGVKVIHDIPGEEFNIDHIVVSQAGVFVIETKTYSKEDKGRPEILFDGEKVKFNGKGSYAEPVNQVRAGAAWTRRLLEESIGTTYPVKPVLLFPGWFVTSTVKGQKSGVWVLEPKALPAYIRNEPTRVPLDQVNLIAKHLRQHVRSRAGRI